MGNIKPEIFLTLISGQEFDEMDKAVYDGTKRFTEICEPSYLNAGNSGCYQLILRGKLRSGSYFSFVGQQGTIMADILHALPDELLGVARDSELLEIIDRAKKEGFRTLIPLSWHNARQMNDGLYDGAAQFDIKPPCLRVGFNCNPDEFVKKVEKLAAIDNQMYNLYVQRARGS